MEKGAAVVITRKYKRTHKMLHLAAAVLTSGATVPITAVKVATNVHYNAQTRQLANLAETQPMRRHRGLGSWADGVRERSQNLRTASRQTRMPDSYQPGYRPDTHN
jgi:hypothetical protein